MTELSTSSPYEAILFDWNGTISDDVPILLGGLRAAYRRRGLSPPDSEILKRLGRWKESAELGVPEREIKNFSQEVVKFTALALAKADLYPGAADNLKRLKRARVARAIGGVAGVAVVTGSYVEMIHPQFHAHNLWETFDAVVATNKVPAKPDPTGIYQALEVIGFDRAAVRPRAVLIGDMDIDIEAAQNAGIDSIWMNHPQNHAFYNEAALQRCRDLKPTYEVQGFDELAKIILPEAPGG